jgi:tetratricopeptide (TPR) repeat protein
MRKLVMKRHLSFISALGMCFVALNITAHAQQVKADTGSIAIGGSVTGSTVIIGIPQEKVDELLRDAKRPLEELTAQQRETIALIKEKLDLTLNQARVALAIVGENDVPPELVPVKLVEIAEGFKALREKVSAQPGDDPKIAVLKTAAQTAIDAGELVKADSLLAEIETEQRRAHDRLALNEAETSARRGDIALTRLRYREAATHFGNAAASFPPASAYKDKWITYLRKEANALYKQGGELGDNGALLLAVERYKALLKITPHDRTPLDWTETQNDLGLALSSLGERETDTVNLEQAIVAFREALTEVSREHVPLRWAAIQNNLANALSSIGQRESGTAKLEEAAVVYQEALTGVTRERAPLYWAMIQHNLGFVLVRLGERERGTVKLERAVIAFREALKEQTRERVPLDWARTQNNLGNALVAIGVRESGTVKLEQAIVAFREALTARTRERAPLQWAMTQNNLGSALVSLGRRESGTAKLEEAVVVFSEALSEQTRERVPLDWARSLGNQGGALMLLAERRQDAAMAETALSQINTAFETMRDGGHAPNAAFYESQLPRARAIVARLRGQ